MPQRTPQPGILPEPNAHALFLVVRVNEPVANGHTVARVAAGLPALIETVARDDPNAGLVCTVGFGSGFWDVIHPGGRPGKLPRSPPSTPAG